jgi:hypothetical protein
MLLAPLLLAAAEPARVSDAAYLADCATHATPAVCRCVADRLQQSSDGRLMLELSTAYAAAPGQSEAQIAAGLAAIRSRYAVQPGVSLGPRLEAVLEPAARACEPRQP